MSGRVIVVYCNAPTTCSYYSPLVSNVTKAVVRGAMVAIGSSISSSPMVYVMIWNSPLGVAYRHLQWSIDPIGIMITKRVMKGEERLEAKLGRAESNHWMEKITKAMVRRN